jgi:hypothetical protein
MKVIMSTPHKKWVGTIEFVRKLKMKPENPKNLLWTVSIRRPLGYEPNTLPLRHRAP